MKIKLTKPQDDFLFSEKRFPAFIAGVGTGKTFMGLLRVWNQCEKHPGSLWLVVRKEFTDLADSTLKDFTRYFGVSADSRKEYHLKNGSTIMFRHGAEVNVLKNITLDGFLMEQAEEFETDDQFTFLRDRLRGRAGPSQQGCIIANANGHNWIWNLWINSDAVDGSYASTKYCVPKSEEHHAVLAQTFDNEANLPEKYVEDLRRMDQESPLHFKQYVMNDQSAELSDDSLIASSDLTESTARQFVGGDRSRRILGIDVARYGGNEIVYSILESRGAVQWEQIHQECQTKRGIDETIGKSISLVRDFNLRTVVVDDDGVGGGVTDLIKLEGVRVIPFRGGLPIKPKYEGEPPRYDMTRSAAYCRVQEHLKKGWLKVMDDPKLHAQLLSIRYKFTPNGSRHVLSKEEMRLKKRESPDRADALMMALWYSDQATSEETEYEMAAMDIPVNYGIRF